DDHIQLAFVAESLQVFDSLVSSYVADSVDTAAVPRIAVLDTLVNRMKETPTDSAEAETPLSGRATGEIDVIGSVKEPRLLVNAKGEEVAWRGIRTPAVSVGFGWNGTSRPEVGLAVNADTLMFGKIAIRELDMVGGGYQDSLRWSGTATLGAATKFSGSGE